MQAPTRCARVLAAVRVLPLVALAGCSAGPWSQAPLFSRSEAKGDRSTVVIEGDNSVQPSPLDRAAKAYKAAQRQTAEVSSRWYADTSANLRKGWDQLATWVQTPAPDSAGEPLTAESKAKLHLAAAAVCESREDYVQAMEYYEQALEEDPELVEARVGRARLFHRRGLLNLAIKEYNRLLEKHPDDALVLNDLGLCYARQGDLEKAEAMLRRAVEQRPTDVRYRNNLATVLVRLGNAPEALTVLQPVVGEAAAHYNVAHFLNDEGKVAEAWRHFHQASELDPSLADARQMANRLAAHAPVGSPR